MIIHELDVDMCAGGHVPLLRLNQGDTDFGILIHLYNSSGIFEIGSGATAKLVGTKPDGSAYEQAATLSGTNVIVAGTSALTDASGKGELEVCLTRAGKNVFSQNIPLRVEREADGGQLT